MQSRNQACAIVFGPSMKRFLITGALVGALAFLLATAPALSLRPYRPDPVDFSIAAAAGAGNVSSPIHTAKRFNMLAVSWRGTAAPDVEVRTRRDGDDWGPWTPVASHDADGPDPGAETADKTISTPTWAGEADWVQYRSDRRLRGVRLVFQNLRGTATRADRLRNGLRRVANAGVLRIAGIARTPIAAAGGPKPAIVSREAWGAEDCQPRTSPEYGEVKVAFVHHTVNANDYTRDEASDVVLGICRFHRNSNGWNDIGYNFLVDRFGTIYEGRAGGVSKAVVGAQAQGYNAQSTGIANLGTFTDVGQTPEALRAMARLIRWKLPASGVPTAGTTTMVSAGGDTNRFPAGRRISVKRVIGHRDTGSTECPGDALYAQLPELRRLVGDVQPGGVSTRVTAKVKAKGSSVAYGRKATVAGRVTVAGSSPLQALPVEIQAFVGSRWKTVFRTTTSLSGSYAGLVKPIRNRNVRARFPGQGDLRASSSVSARLGVKPVITITRRPRSARAGRRVSLRGRVKPRKRYVWQVLQQRRGERWKVVGARRLKVTKKGTFSGSFIASRAGSYRFYVASRRDSATARSASKPYAVRVGR
jgi:N-acetylmuramoyl-L-alanine amidase-like protein